MGEENLPLSQPVGVRTDGGGPIQRVQSRPGPGRRQAEGPGDHQQ